MSPSRISTRSRVWGFSASICSRRRCAVDRCWRCTRQTARTPSRRASSRGSRAEPRKPGKPVISSAATRVAFSSCVGTTRDLAPTLWGVLRTYSRTAAAEGAFGPAVAGPEARLDGPTSSTVVTKSPNVTVDRGKDLWQIQPRVPKGVRGRRSPPVSSAVEVWSMRLSSRATLLVSGLATSALLSACVGAKGSDDTSDPSANADAKNVTLVISANDIVGGKNAAEATWITEKVIPGFVAAQKAKGVTADVTFNGAGVDDEQYKTKLALDLKTGSGADVFAARRHLGRRVRQRRLHQAAGRRRRRRRRRTGTAGRRSPRPCSRTSSFKDKRYGVPDGTDGRVLYFNKKLFAQAGLPADWQPTSWEDIIDGRPGAEEGHGRHPDPDQRRRPRWARPPRCRASCRCWSAPGKPIYDDRAKWQGDTQGVKDVLGFYQQIYGAGLGDPRLQQDRPRAATSRSRSSPRARSASCSRATTSGAR